MTELVQHYVCTDCTPLLLEANRARTYIATSYTNTEFVPSPVSPYIDLHHIAYVCTYQLEFSVGAVMVVDWGCKGQAHIYTGAPHNAGHWSTLAQRCLHTTYIYSEGFVKVHCTKSVWHRDDLKLPTQSCSLLGRLCHFVGSQAVTMRVTRCDRSLPPFCSFVIYCPCNLHF